MFNRRLLIATTTAIALAAPFGTTAASAEPLRIAYFSPSFDTSDAWERTFYAIEGRLEELGVEYEMQALAVASHVDLPASSPRSSP